MLAECIIFLSFILSVAIFKALVRAVILNVVILSVSLFIGVLSCYTECHIYIVMLRVTFFVMLNLLY
jgi:hypothetical protein